MSTTTLALTPSAGLEPRWRTYLKAVTFLLPAFVLWSFACAYFVPKTQQLWMQSGAGNSEAQWVMQLIMFLVHQGGLIVGIVGAACLLLELRVGLWARYRRRILGSVVFLLNLAILLGLWFLCLAVLLAAPALMQRG